MNTKQLEMGTGLELGSITQAERSPSKSVESIETVDLRDLTLPPALAWVMTLVLTCLFTWGIRALDVVTKDTRPYIMLYVIPVAFGSAFLGFRGGVACALLSVVLARVFLYASNSEGMHWMGSSDAIQLASLALGTLTIAFITGRLYTVLNEMHRLNVNLVESEERRLSFNREVLLAVTGGRLRLCELDELRRMVPGEPMLSMSLREPMDASMLRRQLKDLIRENHMDTIRVDDLCTSTMEAATNAIKHGNGGDAMAWLKDGMVSVMITDQGSGISPADLARATLERGFSTRVSLGMGFFMMLEAADTLALCTTPRGTSILLVVGSAAPKSIEENLLARYTLN